MDQLVSQSLPFQVRQAYVARLPGNGSKSFLGYRWNVEWRPRKPDTDANRRKQRSKKHRGNTPFSFCRICPEVEMWTLHEPPQRLSLNLCKYNPLKHTSIWDDTVTVLSPVVIIFPSCCCCYCYVRSLPFATHTVLVYDSNKKVIFLNRKNRTSVMQLLSLWNR